MSDPIAVVLAAGKGTRMKTDLPKVLCEVCDKPIVEYVLDTLNEAGVGRILVVVGYRAGDVQNALSKYDNLDFVEQTEQLGTGHAVQVCRDQLVEHDGAVVVVTGDSPMLQLSSISALLDEFEASQPACILGTLHRDDPTGLGRIVRDADGNFSAIVEHKDATDEQREITEVNMSTYVFNCQDLLDALGKLSTDNEQKELYITDCPGILKSQNKDVRAMPVLKPCESLSINTVDELKIVEDEMRQMLAEKS